DGQASSTFEDVVAHYINKDWIAKSCNDLSQGHLITQGLQRIELRIRVNVADFGLAGLPFRAFFTTYTVCLYFLFHISLKTDHLRRAHKTKAMCFDVAVISHFPVGGPEEKIIMSTFTAARSD
ncbi:hypothetical protein ACJX0J_022754, partial [Zea mays]